MPSNCPAIAQAYSNQCRDAQGGVKKFYITERSNITAYTEASGVLLTITMASGTKFWLYEQEMEKAFLEEKPTTNPTNGTIFYEQNFTASLLKRAASVNYSLRALSVQDVCIIEVEQTGTNFILGIKNGMKMQPSTGGTGTAMGDQNGWDLTWQGKEPYASFTVSDEIITQVTSPA